jgi:hypothetical protein
MIKSLELVWIEQEPVRVFSTAHFQSAATQSGPKRFIEVGEADRAVSRLEHLLTIPHGPAPLTQALLRGDPSRDPLRTTRDFKTGERLSTKKDL